MPKTTRLPDFHSLGLLQRFDCDIAEQSIVVTLDESFVYGVERAVEVRGLFSGVCYLRLTHFRPAHLVC